MGIAIHSYWFEPEDPNRKEDLEAAERAMEFNVSCFFFLFTEKKISFQHTNLADFTF